MSNESEPSRLVGDVTELFEPALRGDRTAQAKLFRRIESKARQIAIRSLRKYSAQDRIRVTELIDEAFLRLVPLLPKPWEIVIDALRETEGSSQALQKTGGDPEEIGQVLNDLIRQRRLAAKIKAVGVDPSAVEEAVAALLRTEEAIQQLQASGGNPQVIRRVLATLVSARPESRASGGSRVPWPHRGAFYAYLCRVTVQTLVDHFRREHGFANSSVIPDILSDTVGSSDDILKQFHGTGGDPDKVSQVLGDIIGNAATARKIMDAGGDPSKVQRAVKNLLCRTATRQRLQEASGDAITIRQALLELFRSKSAKQKLTVYTSVPQEPHDDEGVSRLADVVTSSKGLTKNSIITLQDALEDLDKEFGAEQESPSAPAAPFIKPRRSVHAQIIDLRLFGNCTWEEIAAYLDKDVSDVWRKGRVAGDYMRSKLKDAFAIFDKELQRRQV